MGMASISGIPFEAVVSGEGPQIPDQPRSLGGLLVPASVAAGLIKLPDASNSGILLVQRGDERTGRLSPQKAWTAISKAYNDGRPVWTDM